MIYPSPFHIDGFAGGGGASEGWENATGIPVAIALNHDPEAVAMHRMNHPLTEHHCEDIRTADPVKLCRGRRPSSAWFSPDCKDFSKAKGGKPKSKRIRGLAWTVLHWVNRLGPNRPLVIYMENVEEFAEWCPLIRRGKRKGQRNPKLLGWFFQCFTGALRRRGYTVEWRELRACERSKAPTIRKRLYLVARCDGRPIVWPQHLFGEAKPHRAGEAADILDFTLPCPSLFMTRRQARAYTRRTGIKIQRPLAWNSLQRFADGVERYAMKEADPFLVCLTHEGNDGVDGIRSPFKTVTGANRGERCLGVPFLARQQHGGGVSSAKEPTNTVSASSKDQNQVAVVHIAKMTTGSFGSSAKAAFPTITAGSFKKRPGGNPPLGVCQTSLAAPVCMVPRYGERKGQRPRNRSLKAPMSSITPTSNEGSLASVFLAQNNGGMVGHRAGEPVSTVNGKGANQSLVALGLAAYFESLQDPRLNEGLHTVTTKERFALFAAELGIPVLTPALAKKARRVARFLRRHGVKVEGEFAMCGEFVIVDIGMRMLTARELYRAQGFGDDYIIDRGMFLKKDGTLEERPLTKTAQVRMCGNSVCPPMAEALIRCNQPEYALEEAA